MNIGLFLYSLTVMGKGMAGIFIVTAVIVLTVTLLNRFFSKAK